MGCGSSYVKPFVIEEKGFDLMQVYLTWARYLFTVNGKYKHCYRIEIDDKQVVCESDDPIFDSRPEEIPTTRVLYTGKQKIGNEKDEITSCFMETKSTKTTAEIQMTKNLVKDSQGLDIHFRYPELDSRSGFGTGTVLTGKVKQMEEHEMSWKVNSQIKTIGPGKRKVELSVTEKHLDGHFTLQVAFRGPIKANLWDVSNGKKTLVSHVEGHAEDVLCEFAGFTEIIDKLKKKRAAYKLEGSCHFRYAVEHDVEVPRVEKIEDTSDDEGNWE